MRNVFFILCFVFSALILQTTLFPSFFTGVGELIHWKAIMHQTINFVFLVFMYVCFSRNFFQALFWLFTFVLLQNSFDVPWKGALAISYILMMILIYVLEIMIAFQYSLSSMVIIFVLILIQNCLHLFLGGLFVGFDEPFAGEFWRMILNVVLSFIAVPFVFAILYIIDSRTIFHFDKSKSFFGRRVGL